MIGLIKQYAVQIICGVSILATTSIYLIDKKADEYRDAAKKNSEILANIAEKDSMRDIRLTSLQAVLDTLNGFDYTGNIIRRPIIRMNPRPYITPTGQGKIIDCDYESYKERINKLADTLGKAWKLLERNENMFRIATGSDVVYDDRLKHFQDLTPNEKATYILAPLNYKEFKSLKNIEPNKYKAEFDEINKLIDKSFVMDEYIGHFVKGNEVAGFSIEDDEFKTALIDLVDKYKRREARRLESDRKKKVRQDARKLKQPWSKSN